MPEKPADARRFGRLRRLIAGPALTQLEAFQAELLAERDRLAAALADSYAERDALRDGRDRLRALVRSAPVTLVSIDRGGRITAAEGEGVTILGRSPAQSVGWSLLELFGEGHPVVGAIGEAIAGRSSQASIERDGHTFLVTYSPVQEGDRRAAATAVFLDVSDRQQAELELEEQSLLAEAMVNAQSDLGDLVVVIESGKTTFVNEAAERATGYNERELLALPSFFDLAEAAERPSLSNQVDSGGRVSRFSTTIRHRDGHPIDLDLAGVTVTSGGRTRLVVIGRDVSEKLRAERERRALLGQLVTAEEAERRKIARDLHDDSIQTLFAALIRLHLLEPTITDASGKGLLARLESTLDRAIESLRHLVFELHPTVLAGSGLVAALSEYLEAIKNETGIEVRLQGSCLEEPPDEVSAILYRVAQEALVNARKHSGATQLEVSIEDRDGGIALTVRDNGRGFELDEGLGPRPGHLGLTAMRERVMLAHGRCAVTSAPGTGTVVSAWLPLADPLRGAA